MTNTSPSIAGRLIGAALLSLALVACSSAGASPSAPTTTPTSSGSASPAASLSLAAHVDATVAGLDAALALYKSGNVQGALDSIAATYEDHFELIEGPLETLNDSLKEDLEGTIATKIRQAMSANKPAAEVEALVNDARTKLATAKELLK